MIPGAVRLLLVPASLTACGLSPFRGLLNRHHVALLHRVIISPEQMRRHAAPGPPGLRKFRERLGVRPLTQAESDAGGFLNRQIASRERIGMAEAEQQIDVGGPRPDT